MPDERILGKSLIEILGGLTIITIFSAIAFPSLKSYYRTYKFHQRALEIESTLKWARMVAMERGITVGLCITRDEPNTLRVYDIGTRRSGSCEGTLLRRIKIAEPYINLTATSKDLAFDSRGLGIKAGSIRISRIDTGLCLKYTIQTLRGYIWRQLCQN